MTGDRINGCNSNFSHDDWRIIGISGAVCSGLSILGCLFIIAIMIIYKKYVFTTQRVILYLTISVLLNTIGQLLQRIGYDLIYTKGTYCKILAFTSQYTAWCILLSLCCVLIELLLRIVFFRESGWIEWLYIPVIFILPATVNWIPFQLNAYGAVYCFCSITTIKNCNRDKTGIILETFLWWIPLYTTIIFGFITYGLILYRLSKERKEYTALVELDRDIVYTKTLQDVGYFKWYPLMYFILDIIPMASDINDFTNKPLIPLWVGTSIIKGLQGGFIALAVAMDPKTRKRMTCKSLRAALLYNVFMRRTTEEYPIINGEVSDSLYKSLSEDSK